MSREEEESIDLNKLKPRELLILLHKDVKEMKREQEKRTEWEQTMALKVNTLETKNRIWSGVVGFFSGLVSGMVGGIFSRQ